MYFKYLEDGLLASLKLVGALLVVHQCGALIIFFMAGILLKLCKRNDDILISNDYMHYYHVKAIRKIIHLTINFKQGIVSKQMYLRWMESYVSSNSILLASAAKVLSKVAQVLLSSPHAAIISYSSTSLSFIVAVVLPNLIA